MVIWDLCEKNNLLFGGEEGCGVAQFCKYGNKGQEQNCNQPSILLQIENSTTMNFNEDKEKMKVEKYSVFTVDIHHADCGVLLPLPLPYKFP